ncbi:MAG: hypothetical protein KKA64_01985 [Nanoarchaeota archaeon]|nr:hypothetical protein [Nanoarchaeota archaeon]
MDKQLNKKGEMSSTMLVTIILLIIGFVIILWFWYQLNPTGKIDQETCHESVLFRSTFNLGPFEPGRNIIPLKCKTEKICFGENCEGMIPTKESVVNQVDLNKDNQKAKEQILETIANAMYDCHSMLGEGKLAFMPKTTFTENYCIICSRFEFDKETQKQVDSITYKEFYDYLLKKKTPDGKSYLEYLYPGVTSEQVVQDHFEKVKQEDELSELTLENWKMNTNYEDGYAIVSQIQPGTTWFGKSLTFGAALAGIGLTVGGVALTGTGVLSPIGILIIKVGVTTTVVSTSAVYWYSHSGNGNFKQSPPSIFPYDQKSLTALNCNSFENAP